MTAGPAIGTAVVTASARQTVRRQSGPTDVRLASACAGPRRRSLDERLSFLDRETLEESSDDAELLKNTLVLLASALAARPELSIQPNFGRA
jgi:hypothetical protein